MDPQIPKDRQWVTYREANAITGLGRTSLWKLINASEIEAAHVGRAVRINRTSLTGYMERSAKPSIPETPQLGSGGK